VEDVDWWWNGTWGRLVRRDVYLRRDGEHWEVELREGGSDGLSRRRSFSRKYDALAFVTQALAAQEPGGWRNLIAEDQRESRCA